MKLGETSQHASGLVSRDGDRNSSYGDPKDDFARTVAIFNTLTGRDLSVADGVLFMICVKLSREAHGHKLDNMIDLCGYADILNYIREGLTA